jgi:hypothetical protein
MINRVLFREGTRPTYRCPRCGEMVNNQDLEAIACTTITSCPPGKIKVSQCRLGPGKSGNRGNGGDEGLKARFVK